jgi:3-hydroxyisobutyrate dehydrogenase
MSEPPRSPEVARPTVAVLGTGTMGAPIARNLLHAGFPVRVWNRTAERAQALAGDGARPVSSPAEAVAPAELVLTMLADGDAVMETMTGAGGAAVAALGPQSVWVQMGTVGLDWTERLRAIADEHDVEFVDAPVSGSQGPASEGTLLVLASGPDGARERVQPLFDAIGERTLWLGPAGNGTRLKLVLNNWLAILVEGLAETLALSEALGLDPRQFIDTIDGGPLGSPFALTKAGAMIEGDFSATFALRLGLKDVRLALAAAHRQRLELPLTNALLSRWDEAVADGHGDDDIASVFTRAERSSV